MKYSNKGFIFTGCSFTWGYGLNYYYSFTKDNGEFYGNISQLEPKPPILFQYCKRFSNKVANHYNTFHIQPDRVSGSDVDNINWLEYFLKKDWDSENVDYSFFKSSDFHTLIFQTSYLDRGMQFIWEKLTNKDNEYFNSYEEIIEEIGDSELQRNYYHDQIFEIVSKMLIDICKKFESLGITVYFIHATDIYKHTDYIKERTIKISHKEKEYFCINNISDDDSSALIALDFDNFKGTPPDDLHPSLKVHESIYKSILNKLDND